MNLRVKLFILLAAVALVPLVLLAAVDVRDSRQLGRQLADANTTELVGGLTHLLNRTVLSSATSLDELADECALAVRVEAAAADRALASPAPFAAVVYPVGRWDGPQAQWPPGTRVARLGESQPLPVSFLVQGTLVPPGADAGDDAERLAAVNATSRELYSEHSRLFLSIILALDSGPFVVFPGRGQYAPNFDARARSWYRELRAARRRIWTAPFISASTHQLAMTVAAPIHRPDGGFAGVAAIEIAIVDLLRGIDRTTFDNATTRSSSLARFADSIRSVLIVPEASGGGTARLRVLAERETAASSGDWKTAPKFGYLMPPEGPAFRAVSADLLAGRSGIARLTYEGHDTLWAYAAVPALHAALLVSLPFDGIVAAAEVENAALRARAAAEVRETLAIAVAILLAVAVLALIVSGVATRSIRALVEVTVRIGAGDLRARAAVRGSDEIATLAGAINTMVPKLEDGLRMQASLDLAHAVQQNLLPTEAAQVPGFDIAGVSVYCDETGGDYYDFVEIAGAGRPSLAIAVGDVSGHGIAAAFLMAGARAALRVSLGESASLGTALRRTNQLLCADLNDGSFMTMVVLVIDDEKGTLRWANAAHDAPLVYHPATDTFVELSGTDVALGVRPDWTFAEHETVLPSGEVVIAVATDGIWETLDASGEAFGRARLRALVREHASATANDLCRSVLADVAGFRGTSQPADDVTLVAIKCTVRAAATVRVDPQTHAAPT